MFFFTISILDKIIDFDEYDNFTLNGIEYEKPGRNSPSEDFELYKKMQEEYFETNNISLYGRNKDSIFNIVFLLAVILMARTILKTLSSLQPK